MPTPRQNLTASVVNGRCYTVGGETAENGHIALSVVEAYDPVTDQWTTLADMPTARIAPAAAVIDDVIYVVGGWRDAATTAESYLDVVEAYNPATDSWSTLRSMSEVHAFFTASAVDGKLYVMGGAQVPAPSAGTDIVEVYDPATNRWSTLAPMPSRRFYLSSSVVNGKIYAIGGALNGDDVNVYDPSTNTWSPAESLPGVRNRHTSEVVQGINAGLNGNWWNGPARSGEGAQIEVADAGEGALVFVATVYSYDTMGNQIFLVAVGSVNGDTAEVDVFITEGGVWGEDFDPALVIELEWGTGTFTANNCDVIHMELTPNQASRNLGFTDLAYELVRLTTPLIPCPA
jgi:N-acetylneuraminic acid mutarotase